MRGLVVLDKALLSTQEKSVTRVVTMHGFLNTIVWHRIDIKDSFVIRNKADRRPTKSWVEPKSHKAYIYKEAGGEFANLLEED
jgi:hypothetical protein